MRSLSFPWIYVISDHKPTSLSYSSFLLILISLAVGLSPPVIGYLLAFFGLFNGLFQIFFFARINDHFGTKRVFVAGMLTFIPVFALFPIMSALAKEAQAVTTLVWLIAGFQTLLSIAVSLSYGASFGWNAHETNSHVLLIRMCLHFHCRFIPEQGLSRCHKWYCPTRYINHESDWPSRSKLAVLAVDEARDSQRVFRLSCACNSFWCGGGVLDDPPDAGVEEVGGLMRFHDSTYDFPQTSTLVLSFFMDAIL